MTVSAPGNITLIATYDEYQKLVMPTLSVGPNRYADFLHMACGLTTEVSEVLEPVKRYFAYEKFRDANLKGFDFKIFAEELGDIAWECAVLRHLKSEVLGTDSVAQHLPLTRPEILSSNTQGFFGQIFQELSVMSVLASSLMLDFAERHRFEAWGDAQYVFGQADTNQETDRLQMLAFLLSRPHPSSCETHRALADLSSHNLLLKTPSDKMAAIETSAYRCITMVGLVREPFTVERVWTANIAKLQQKRYRKNRTFDVFETLNRHLLDEDDIIRSVMGECCAKV